MGELVAAIESRLPAGSVRLLTSAKSVSLADGRWRVVTDDGMLDGRAVVVATPAHIAARLLERTDPLMAGLCAEIPYVSTVSIALAWPRASVGHPLAGSGFVVAHAAQSVADQRVHVGLVQVGRSRPARHGAVPRLSWWRD